MEEKCITLKTQTPSANNPNLLNKRNVTLFCSSVRPTVVLLGNLAHNTELVIDQELIDQLQARLNEMNQPQIPGLFFEDTARALQCKGETLPEKGKK